MCGLHATFKRLHLLGIFSCSCSVNSSVSATIVPSAKTCKFVLELVEHLFLSPHAYAESRLGSNKIILGCTMQNHPALDVNWFSVLKR
ncbi:hypothetical protein GDO78_011084 [Eleutherodactylus coqui]|uniref:Secreted protein n=1 Tax=Eleutherodactylus coqui TaxID=57060 RepID=A0A8J6F7K5_ELECQ|nr:hypothetical protein GDO78_011084 [Eleutherodactylus coqui]